MRLAGLVGHYLDGGDHADAAHIADMRVGQQLAQAALEARTHLGGALHQPLVLDDRDIAQRDGRAGGVARVGKACIQRCAGGTLFITSRMASETPMPPSGM